ncbi:MAG: Smr/MutS family protein [Patescibacteria group bacterium]
MKWRNVAEINPLEPEQMDPIEFAIYAAELSADTPSINLHELDPDFAKDAFQHFLNKEFSEGQRRKVKVVKIIHGRGSGFMRKVVTDYLEEVMAQPDSFIIRYQTSKDPSQANGVTLVVLAPNKR